MSHIISQMNQSIHVPDGMKVMSLSASLLQKISAATALQCQIALNLKLLHNLKSGVNFQVELKVKSCRK
jgi:hypothetical protein